MSGYLYCGGSYGDELQDWEIVADPYQCDKLNEHYGALGKEAKLPIYATQQPTQAQAGAVPLTLRWCAHCGEGVTNFCRSKPAGDCPIGLPRIKGGQLDILPALKGGDSHNWRHMSVPGKDIYT